MSCTHDCGCTPETRDARTDEWVQIAPESARDATLTPEQPVKAPGQGGDSQRPSEPPVLPRQITPEDVRVGMVVERRKGDAAMRDRVHLIDNALIGLTGFCLWMPEYAAVGWSLWLVEDAPEPVDPDAADRQCAWADYRKDYGVGESGWKSAREGDQSGPLR